MMDDPLTDAVKQRISRHPAGLTPKPHVFYERTGGRDAPSLVGINCKICETPIMGTVESERLQKTVRHNGRNIIIKYLTHSRFGLYTEVLLTFADGSRHQTHLCRNCVQKLADPQMLEYVYACDLAQWLSEEGLGRGDALWHAYPQVVDRVPISFEDMGGLN